MPDHHPGLIPSGGVTKLSPNADLVQQRRCRGSGALYLSVRACVAPNQRCGAALSWLAGVAPWHHSAAAAAAAVLKVSELFPEKPWLFQEKLQLFSEKRPLFPEKRKAELRARQLSGELPPVREDSTALPEPQGWYRAAHGAALDPLPAPMLRDKGGGSRDKKCADSTMLLRGVSDVYTLYTDILIAVGKNCTK